MNPAYARCALRLQRLGAQNTRYGAERAFSCTVSRHGVPTFEASSNPELDDLLASFRKTYLIPAYLKQRERNLIFKEKNKSTLENNPQYVEIDGERIELQWLDMMKDIPNRRRSIRTAIKLMAEGEKSDWNNLFPLLVGLHHMKTTLEPWRLRQIVRKALEAGQFNMIMHCLQSAKHTGITLKQDEVFYEVLQALRDYPQRAGWTQDRVAKALEQSRVIAELLETEEHGAGAQREKNDIRQRPELVATFLELAGIYAVKFQDGRDTDAKVKTYANRLMSCIASNPESLRPRAWEPPARGPVGEASTSVPIWHAIRLAQGILGKDMPRAELAEKTASEFEAGLSNLTSILRERVATGKGTYGGEAIRMFRDCFRLDGGRLTYGG